jgi:short subunit dehydrogenase-like uncharacterized protein
MAKENVLIYGANGYTGRLITELAVLKGMKPVIAGRNKEEIEELAKKYSLEYLVFTLEDKDQLAALLDPFVMVVHCAGPFFITAKPMIKACLKAQTHYLDITGEIEVFEYAASKNKDAKEAGILIMPGVGFDVVPSDCLAAHLSAKLPGATHLELAFKGSGGLSKGTATTMAENFYKGGAIRKDGRIRLVPAGYETKRIRFPSREYLSTTIPWGDVSTAFHSTGIPNIKVFMSAPKKMITFLKYSNHFKWLLKTNFVRGMMRRNIAKKVTGPSEQMREKGKSELWGKVSRDNDSFEATLTTPEGYKLTAMTAVGSIEKLLAQNVFSGFKTPSIAFGPDFILEFEGTERKDG